MRRYYQSSAAYTRRTGTDSLVVHCADTYPSQDIGVKEIRDWHVDERGWIDIGYQFVIRRDGTLEHGRPIWAMGAGVRGWNANSIHGCLVGGRKPGTGPGTANPVAEAEDNFTPEQMRTLYAELVIITELNEGSERVLGHRDYPGVTKYCPSFDVRAWWKAQGAASHE